MKNLLTQTCLVLLLTTFSSTYAGSCSQDISDCKAKAEQGVAEAQYNVGLMYIRGEGVPQDYKQAFEWLSKAAEQGVAQAQHNVGVLYYIGEGVPQDYKQAFEWYSKAAEQGNAQAQLKVGLMYAYERGTPQNNVTAHMYFNLAAANGNKDAAIHRERITKKMTTSQITEAQKLAREWMSSH